MPVDLPKRWLTNSIVILANGFVRRLLLVASIDLVQFSAKSRHSCGESHLLDQQVISAVELQFGGPTAELLELWKQVDYKEYWDDVNGGFLDPRLVRETRLLELDWIKKGAAGARTRQPESPNVHISGPLNKERKLWRGGKKKREILGPHPSGPTLRCPTLRCPTLRCPTLRGPTFSRFGLMFFLSRLPIFISSQCCFFVPFVIVYFVPVAYFVPFPFFLSRGVFFGLGPL